MKRWKFGKNRKNLRSVMGGVLMAHPVRRGKVNQTAFPQSEDGDLIRHGDRSQDGSGPDSAALLHYTVQSDAARTRSTK